jgi:hypothetical protein
MRPWHLGQARREVLSGREMARANQAEAVRERWRLGEPVGRMLGGVPIQRSPSTRYSSERT